MKQTKIFIVVILVLLAALGGGATYLFLTQNKQTGEQASTTALTPTPTTQPETTEPEETTNIPAGWLTYTNEEYGFAISYPSNYQALDDANNLYGWPKGIVLFYGGGQSYDLPIEVWNTVAEYESKYPTQMDNLTVHQVGSKYITLLNANFKAEVDQIIATFRTIP